MQEILLNGIAVILFAVTLLLYKLNTRKIYYNKIALVCIALVLIPLAAFLNDFLPYLIQLVLLAAFAHFGNEYHKRGLFRRRQELHEIYRSRKREHREAKENLYPHLKDLAIREKRLEKELDKVKTAKEELREHARQIKTEREELERAKKAVKAAHFEVLAEREDKK